jgi:hypothetical protein
MGNQNWVSLLTPNNPNATGAGAALSTATTATLSPTTGVGVTSDVAVVQAPGVYQGWSHGLLIRVTARGFVTTVATAGTLTFLLTANKGNAGTYVTLATTAAINTPAAANTGIPWKLEAVARCTNAGVSSGNSVSTQGEMVIGAIAAQTILTATAGVNVALPNASGETAAAVDTTQLQGIALRCTQATSTCTVQLTQWLAETLD